ncbi:MAG: NADH-dependent [FeFe] hydrogenase, group A6 [Fusobacteriaceae bacterium]
MDITLKINGKQFNASGDETIMEVCHRNNIGIPHLCHLKIDGIYTNECASCRICVVEVDKKESLFPSCATKVWEGMEVITNSPELLNIRRGILELILSNHPKDCLVCEKSGQCELQNLSQELRVKEIRYPWGTKGIEKEMNRAISRDLDKCIMCRRCETMCNTYQTCNIISAVKRGINSVITTPYNKSLEDGYCTFCGQCVAVCPTGALTERDYTWKLLEILSKRDKTVIAQIAPAVRVALGEELGYPPGTNVEKKITSALKELGFQHVFDTSWGADLTVMEEAVEFRKRLEEGEEHKGKIQLPLLTSCCPAWINFLRKDFPDLLGIASTTKSPQQMFSSVAKEIWAKKIGVSRENLVVVSVMPCLAKKQEAHSPEYSKDGNYDTDLSISTRELAHMIKSSSINFDALQDSEMDNPLGLYSGAGVIFGRTGGVVEATLRTAYKLITEKEMEELEFIPLENLEDIRKAEILLGDRKIRIGIAHGLGSARKLLEMIRSGEEKFHGIEIMACKGGCIGGGGQPYIRGDVNILKKRIQALNAIDEGKTMRRAHENPMVQKIYRDYLGAPGSLKAKELLHRKTID